MGLVKADLGSGVYASAIFWVNSNTTEDHPSDARREPSVLERLDPSDPLLRTERKQSFFGSISTIQRPSSLFGSEDVLCLNPSAAQRSLVRTGSLDIRSHPEGYL